MQSIKVVTLFYLLSLLLACSNGSALRYSLDMTPQSNLYLDGLFLHNALPAVESPEEIFAIDQSMKAMVAEQVKGHANTRDKTEALIAAIFSIDSINLHYASGADLTAQETFYSGSANCISLTILAYVLAQEAGIDIDFQKVEVPEYWLRNGEFNMLTGHVNLRVNMPKNNYITLLENTTELSIDFDPFIAKQRFSSKTIAKNTMLAIFYNNKGAHALAFNNYALSYQYLKQATLMDPTFSAAWANLGILYKKQQRYTLAEKSYLQAIYLNNDNYTAIGNLAILFRSQQKREQAQQLDLYVLKKRINNPYYYAMLAEQSTHNKKYKQAIVHYKKAISLNPSIHEFYIALSKNYLAINEYLQAQKMVKKAMKLSHDTEVTQSYIAKLSVINQQQVLDK